MDDDVKYHDEKYNFDGTQRSEADFKKRVAERKKEEEKEQRELQEKIDDSNKILLEVPADLTDKEKEIWLEFAKLVIAGSKKIKTAADKEFIRQYVCNKILRDTAWVEWNKNPVLHDRIVTGIEKDGKTPKVTIKDNQHYAIFTEANKRLEEILDSFNLLYKTRTNR